jgi:hypothetical protein
MNLEGKKARREEGSRELSLASFCVFILILIFIIPGNESGSQETRRKGDGSC